MNLFQIFQDEILLVSGKRWRQLRKLKFRGPFEDQDIFLTTANVAPYIEEVEIVNIVNSTNSEWLSRLVRNQQYLTSLKLSSFTSLILDNFFRGFVGKDLMGTFEGSSLTRLDFASVDLTQVNLLILLQHFPNLKSLNFSLCDNSVREINDISYADKICPNLTSFTIFYTTLDSKDICQILQNADKLQIFQLCSSFSTNIPIIAQHVAKGSSNLTELHLNDLFLPHINRSLKAFRQLKHLLIVSHTSIYQVIEMGGEELKTFGSSIPKNLRELDILCNWKFLPDDFRQFLENCQANLKYLYLGFCNTIGYDHVKTLQQFLSQRHHIQTKYYIPNNNISKFSKIASNHFYCRLVARDSSEELSECGNIN